MATYYVATSGNNGNPGTIGSPFLTISHGVGVLAAGDTLYIRAGTYDEMIEGAEFTASGTSGSPILVSGYPGETVTIRNAGTTEIIKFYISGRQYIEFQDLTLDGSTYDVGAAVYLQDESYITFRRLIVKNAWANGFLVSGSGHRFLDLIVHSNGRQPTAQYSQGHNGIYSSADNCIVQGGFFYNNQSYGIRFADSSASHRSSNNVIEGCRVYTNGYGKGLNGTSTSGSGGGGIVIGDINNVVRNCIVNDNLIGIEISGFGGVPAEACKVYNNTIYGNVGYGVGHGLNAGANNSAIRNNIIYGNGDAITTYTVTNATVSHNLTTDPSFTNAPSADFTLLVGSAAIDAGTTIASVTDDHLGATRPAGAAYDIGAYEYGATGGGSPEEPPAGGGGGAGGGGYTPGGYVGEGGPVGGSSSPTTLTAFAEVDLNDHESYYGGYKAPKVLEWHQIQRGLSDHMGQIQHLQFGAIYSDIDYFFRTLLDDPVRKFLTNRPSTMRIIHDEQRRLEEEPMIIANGFIGDYAPLDNLRFEVKCYDWMRRRFTRRASSNESWQPRITLQDFPNANGTIQTDEGGLDYSNAGMVIPIIYGRITDTNYSDPGPIGFNNPDVLSDQGDGQFVPIYVGDYQLAGETWRGALVAAHCCAYIEAGFLFHDPVDLENDPDWLTPRRVAEWGAAGFDPVNSAITINGRDYCMIFLKGYAGDVFAGKEPIPEIRQGKFGNVPIAINVWGRTDNGRGDGLLLTNGFDIYLDFLQNYVASETKWQSGLALEIPEFPTIALQVIDVESFTAAVQTADLRVGGGYQLDFVLGDNNKNESLMDIIAEFNVNLDCEAYFNRFGQLAIAMEPEDDSEYETAVNDVTDITAGSLKVVDQVSRNFWNILSFRHTFDYTGRMQQQFRTDWRSEMTGDLERRHQSSIDNYEQERPSAVYEFKFIRGRNRLSDSPYYDQGSATAEDVMMHLAARYADPRRIVTLATAFNGLHYECGDVLPISTVEGIGSAGWDGRMMRVINHIVHPSKGQVLLECYDLRSVIERREELTTSTGGSPGGSPEYSPPDVGSPGSPAGSP